jgi:hypothetical protein
MPRAGIWGSDEHSGQVPDGLARADTWGRGWQRGCVRLRSLDFYPPCEGFSAPRLLPAAGVLSFRSGRVVHTARVPAREQRGICRPRLVPSPVQKSCVLMTNEAF